MEEKRILEQYGQYTCQVRKRIFWFFSYWQTQTEWIKVKGGRLTAKKAVYNAKQQAEFFFSNIYGKQLNDKKIHKIE